MERDLVTDRLLLRPLTIGDVDDLVALDGDPEVMRYLTGGRPTSRDEIQDRLLREQQDVPTYRAALERSTGAFVGWFELRPVQDGAELGYRLRRNVWGRGLATEGSRAVVDAGFAGLGVRRVVATTMAVNVRSRRVLEKTGLSYVRTVHLQWTDPIPGSEHGDVEYELTRATWQRRETLPA